MKPLTKEERAIVEQMNRRRVKKTVEKAEPDFQEEKTTVTVDKAPAKIDASEDVAMLKELRD